MKDFATFRFLGNAGQVFSGGWFQVEGSGKIPQGLSLFSQPFTNFSTRGKIILPGRIPSGKRGWFTRCPSNLQGFPPGQIPGKNSTRFSTGSIPGILPGFPPGKRHFFAELLNLHRREEIFLCATGNISVQDFSWRIQEIFLRAAAFA